MHRINKVSSTLTTSMTVNSWCGVGIRSKINSKWFILLSVPKCLLVVSFQDSLVDRPNRLLSKMSKKFFNNFADFVSRWCH